MPFNNNCTFKRCEFIDRLVICLGNFMIPVNNYHCQRHLHILSQGKVGERKRKMRAKCKGKEERGREVECDSQQVGDYAGVFSELKLQQRLSLLLFLLQIR